LEHYYSSAADPPEGRPTNQHTLDAQKAAGVGGSKFTASRGPELPTGPRPPLPVPRNLSPSLLHGHLSPQAGHAQPTACKTKARITTHLPAAAKKHDLAANYSYPSVQDATASSDTVRHDYLPLVPDLPEGLKGITCTSSGADYLTPIASQQEVWQATNSHTNYLTPTAGPTEVDKHTNNLSPTAGPKEEGKISNNHTNYLTPTAGPEEAGQVKNNLADYLTPIASPKEAYRRTANDYIAMTANHKEGRRKTNNLAGYITQTAAQQKLNN
jgi:hypothetical protein